MRNTHLNPAQLMPFDATARLAWAIPFAFEDYLELVETLGRCVHPRKRGQIPGHTPPLLERLGMNTEDFIQQSANFLQHFGCAVGTPEHLTALAARRQVRYLHGIKAARALQQAA